jgi:TatD DNase family protein
LLLETDAPSIATQTTVASRVEPWHTAEVAKKIAELKGLSREEICNVSAANALKVFRLEKAGLKV